MPGYGLTERVSFVYLARRLLVACGIAVDEWRLATRVLPDDYFYETVLTKKLNLQGLQYLGFWNFLNIL